MKKVSDKLQIIYKPFLFIVIGFIITYTFLHWLLFIKAGIPLKEEILEIWLPFTLPFIPVLIWLRPRIKLLKFKNDNRPFVFQFLAVLVIVIPTIIAQEYLITATGKITKLDNISQIDKQVKTKYYSLKNYYIDKQHIAIQYTSSVTGRYNDDFNMLIYVVMPILENRTDSVKTENRFWLGKKYFEQISNRLSAQEKEDKYKIFADKSQKEFEETDFSKFTYLEVIGNTEEHDEYNNALKKSAQSSSEYNIVFNAKTGAFEARNGKKLPWIFGSLGIGLAVFLVLLLFTEFQERKLEEFKSGKIAKDTDFKDMVKFFIPRRGFFITPIIIDLNILIFMAMVISGLGFTYFKGSDLLNLGANYRPLTTNGQWWRLLTNTFLHGGLMHVLANMYGLLFVGLFLEPILGKIKYTFVYLATGILASAASIWWYDATVSVGASGAIFGLYGFFLACLLLKVFPPEFGKAFLASTLIFIGFNLLMGIAGGIDNAAHIGGLLSGFILGLIMSGQLRQQTETENEYEPG